MVNIQSALTKFNPKFQWNAIIIKALNHQSVSHWFTFEADYSCFTNTVFRNTQKTVTSFTLLATSAEHIFNQPIYPFKSNILFFHYAHNIHTLHTQIYTTSCQNTSHTKKKWQTISIFTTQPPPPFPKWQWLTGQTIQIFRQVLSIQILHRKDRLHIQSYVQRCPIQVLQSRTIQKRLFRRLGLLHFRACWLLSTSIRCWVRCWVH